MRRLCLFAVIAITAQPGVTWAQAKVDDVTRPGEQRIDEGGVDLRHFAGGGGVDVAGGLDRLDCRAGVVDGQFAADLGQLDEDDFGQLILRVVGDTDCADAVLDAQPFVGV